MNQLHPNYGIDAPGVVKGFVVVGCNTIIAAFIVALVAVAPPPRPSLVPVAITCFVTGLMFMVTPATMLWGSRFGKLRLRDKLLDSIAWRGDEHVLDVGCGHGLMLIGAAKRAPKGKAVGIDLWQQDDQQGNSRQATMLNVEIEDVADQIELRDGDARALPFADASFDVVVSSWALHNIYDAVGRRKALAEIARVLKPGGRVVLIDISHGAEYASALRELGLSDITMSRPYFTFFIPSRAVFAGKPS